MNSDYHNPTNQTSTRASTLRAALEYAEQDVRVFPCKRGGKAPLIKDWPNRATTDKSRITAWFNRWPDANIASPVPDDEAIIDVDRDRYGYSSFEELEGKYGEPPQTHTTETGRGGLHHRFKVPDGVRIKSRANAFGLMGVDVKAHGGYVILPPSTTEGPYRELDPRAPVELPPAWVEALREPERVHRPESGSATAVSTGVDGPPIPDGTRNDTLASIAGRLHDGSRTREQLAASLQAVNKARCVAKDGRTPYPLPEGEVREIARSIHRREPCKPARRVTPAVLAALDHLEALASERPTKGMAGASGWAIYMAGLEAARHHGREHPDGVEISLDMRTWAQMAGTHAATVSRFIRRSPLVRVTRRGSGRRSGVVVLIVPGGIGSYLQHSTRRGVSIENEPRSVATRPLLRTLYRLRWGAGRVGKSRAAIVKAVVECPGAARFELAHRLGRKPESLKKPLKWLIDAGLLVRIGRGRYDVPEDLLNRVEDARELGREPEADRLQIARHDRERDGYRNRHWIKPDPIPERPFAGEIAELERVPEAGPVLVGALATYLRRNPHRRHEYPSWLANTLWCEELVDFKPSGEQVEAALAELLPGAVA